MSSAQSQSTPDKVESRTPILPDEMGIAEVMRVMDVASTLRREQEIVEREFNLEQTKEMLREKLRNTAELTGETLTPEQIEAAVNWYYDNLHEYQEPEKSFTWYLAHIYVRRTAILAFLLPILFGIGAIWSLWFAPFAPFSATNRLNQDLRSANQKIEKRIKSIRSIAKSDSVKSEVARLEKESKALFENQEIEGLSKIHSRLSTMDARLNEDFTITVVSGEGRKSGIDRYFKDNFSGYYLIVQARDKDGKVLKRKIQNIETDKIQTVDTWGEKVPKSVFDRLVEDKKMDGILNETIFGKKIRGELEVQMIMPGPNQEPIERSGQITDW